MKNRTLLLAVFAFGFFLSISIPKRSTHSKAETATAAASTKQAPRPSPAPSVAALMKPKDNSNSGTDTANFRTWLRGTQSGAIDLARGRELAAARREQMLQWFQEDPARAYAESLSWSEWNSVPPEVKDLVERPFSAVVDFSVLPNCPPADPSLPRIHPHKTFFEGEWRETYVFGSKKTLTTKEGLPARGIILDEKVVLADSAFESLSGQDLAVVRKLYPEKGGANRSAVSGKSLGAERRTLLLGGSIYAVASAQEEAELNEVLVAASKSFNPKSIVMALGTAATGTNVVSLKAAGDGIMRASSTWTETPKTTLAVRINYSDTPAFSYTLTEMTNLMRNASNAVKIMSYGKSYLVPRVASVTLPKTWQAYQNGGPDLIVNDTRTALSGIGINASSYQFIVHAHPGMNFGYAGLGQIGGGICWLNGNVSLEVTVHELGHNYGLGHAHFWAGVTGNGSLGRTQADGSSVEREEYGDPYDIMGGSSLPAGQYNAYGKMALNWIEPKEVINVVTNGIYRIHRYDHQNARTNIGTKLALRVPAPSGETYVVSHRRLFTTNPSLFRGANIARVDGPGDQSLIDTTPLSRGVSAFSNDKSDAGLAIGKTFSDPLGTVRITTIASAGASPLEYLDVQVTFADGGAYSFYTTSSLATNGLVGSYVNRSLRTRPAQDDWRSASGVTVSGQRVDQTLNFTSDGWGARAPLRLTLGTDANWENFSVQWDGMIVVRRPIRLATTSDDSSRFWIDLDADGSFATTEPEFVNNNWGVGQGATRGDISGLIEPGVYAIRIQYEEGNGGNYFTIGGADVPFELFTNAEATEPGLTGSYVARSLRTATQQADWRVTQAIAGTRTDAYPGFTVNSLGSLSEAGLADGVNGSDSDWDNFSVQWDGYLKVSVPVKMATISDDHSRMWIDLNTNDAFATTTPEYINNGWGGGGQGVTVGQISTVVQPGIYPIRIQYEEGGGGNYMLLAGVPQAPADAPVLLGNTVFAGTENRTAPRTIEGDFTIQFWLKTAQIAGSENDWRDGVGLVDASAPGAAPGFGVSLGNGKVLFGISDGTSSTTLRSDVVSDDKWHHVTARREQASGGMTLFVDGLVVASGVATTNSLDSLANLTIGSLTGATQYFVGSIDQLRTWGAVRTDAQIAADFHSTRNTHGFVDEGPIVRITPGPNSVQIFWDAISGYRTLEAATTVDGTYTALPTDQNSTNMTSGGTTRFFRIRR